MLNVSAHVYVFSFQSGIYTTNSLCPFFGFSQGAVEEIFNSDPSILSSMVVFYFVVFLKSPLHYLALDFRVKE